MPATIDTSSPPPSLPPPPRRRVLRWLFRSFVLTLLLIGGYAWYSTLLTPGEKRMLGTWESPELWLGEPSEAIEFRPDRITVPFAVQAPYESGFRIRAPDGGYLHLSGEALRQSGKLGNWRRKGDTITIYRRDPEWSLKWARIKSIAHALWNRQPIPDIATHLQVVEETENIMVIDDLRETPPRRITFRRLLTAGDVPQQDNPDSVQAEVIATPGREERP